MLIVDPDPGCATAEDAIQGIRAAGLSSPNMLTYFPRMRQRVDDADRTVAVGGAVAGLLCKLDRDPGRWLDSSAVPLRFNRRFRPDSAVDDESAPALARAGINAITSDRAGAARLEARVTLGRNGDSPGALGSLPVRRLLLRLLADIDRGTRWAVFDADRATLEQRLQDRVATYLDEFLTAGALEAVASVRADLAPVPSNQADANRIRLHIVFTPVGCTRPLALTLHQSVDGCRTAVTAFGPAGP